MLLQLYTAKQLNSKFQRCFINFEFITINALQCANIANLCAVNTYFKCDAFMSSTLQFKLMLPIVSL